MENRFPIRVFADDMAVTSTYWETVMRKNYSQPEKELMLAVLKDALMTYKKRVHSGNARLKRPRLGSLTRKRIAFFRLKRFALSSA